MTHLLCAQQLHGQCGHQGPEGSGLLFKVTHLMRQRPVLNPMTSRRLSPKIQETRKVRGDQETQADDHPLGWGAPNSCPSPSLPVLGKTTTSDGNCVKGKNPAAYFPMAASDRPTPERLIPSPSGRSSFLPPSFPTFCHTHTLLHIHALSHTITESYCHITHIVPFTYHTATLTFIHTQSGSHSFSHTCGHITSHTFLSHSYYSNMLPQSLPVTRTVIVTLSLSHTPSHTPCLTHSSLTHSYPHSYPSLSVTVTVTRILVCIHILSQHHKFSVTQCHTITRSHTHTHTHSVHVTHTLSHCHMHKHSYTVSRMFTCALS